MRLVTVLTDAPLPLGQPVTTGECGTCQVCVNECPAQAIVGQEWYAGLLREALLDAMACQATAQRLLRERVGVEQVVCGVCVAVCPHGRM